MASLRGFSWLPLGLAVVTLIAGCAEPNSREPATADQPDAANSIADPVGDVVSGRDESAERPAGDEPAPRPLFDGWPKPAVALVITGQQLGYIEPCGCSGLENQKGGLARRHTLIRQLAEERGWPVVPLDVGNQVRRFGKQQEIKFEHVVRGLRTMGYRAVALGEHDLGLSPAAILASITDQEQQPRDFVGANVAVLARELMPRHVVVEAGGKRIGITAVLGEKYQRRIQGDEIVHEPPRAALKEAAGELKSQACDLYILLAHAPLDEARRLAADVPIFDLVIASGETSVPSHELQTVEGTKTRLMQVGQKAMYVGVVGVFDDEAMPLRYESVPLDARFPDSKEMLQLLADYQEVLQQLGLEELEIRPIPHPSGRTFVGSQTCGECHTKAHEKWSSTPHAHAIDSIVTPPNSRGDIARHYDPECLSCHVTGWEPQRYFPYVSGYLGLEKTPHLIHNGCENCHGPGSAHVAAESGDVRLSDAEIAKLRDAMKLPLAGGVAEQRCLKCHDEDNSPDFHKPGAFERYWAKVEHRGKD